METSINITRRVTQPDTIVLNIPSFHREDEYTVVMIISRSESIRITELKSIQSVRYYYDNDPYKVSDYATYKQISMKEFQDAYERANTKIFQQLKNLIK